MSSTAPRNNSYSTNQKVVLIFYAFIAIVTKCILTYYFYKFDDDKLNQAAAALNLVEGHGITIKEAQASDLSTGCYKALGKWPPGYTLLLAPIYLLVKDLETSTYVLHFLSIVLFFIVLLYLLKKLQVGFAFTGLFVLFNGVSFYQDIITSAPTDLLAATFCIYACAKAVEINTKPTLSILSFSIANNITAILRYMYWPVSLVLPLFLLWNGIKRKDTPLRKKGVTSFLAAVVTCLALYLYEMIYVGDTLYLNPTEKGIFFSNLLTAYPFTVTTVLNIDFYGQQLAKLFSVDYTIWMAVFSVLHFLIFLLLCIFFFRRIWVSKALTTEKRESFMLLAGIITCTVLALLAVLSVRISSYYPPPNTVFWTYLSDGRYYIFTLVTLPIVFYLYVIHSKKEFRLRKYLSIAFVSLLSLEIAHGLYFTTKVAGDLHPSPGSYQIQKRAESYIKAIIDADKKNRLTTVVASHMPYFAHAANTHGGLALFNSQLLIRRELNTTKPVHLLLFISKKNLGYYKSFIERPRTSLVRRDGNLYCFSTYLYPKGF